MVTSSKVATTFLGLAQTKGHDMKIVFEKIIDLNGTQWIGMQLHGNGYAVSLPSAAERQAFAAGFNLAEQILSVAKTKIELIEQKAGQNDTQNN